MIAAGQLEQGARLLPLLHEPKPWYREHTHQQEQRTNMNTKSNKQSTDVQTMLYYHYLNTGKTHVHALEYIPLPTDRAL